MLLTNGQTKEKKIIKASIFIVKSRTFKCTFKHARAAFYRSFNTVFGRIGRIAKENVVVEILQKKCLPVLLYATEVCPMTKSDIDGLRFAVNNALMKIFDTKCKDVVETCAYIFGLSDISVIIANRKSSFDKQFCMTDNLLYKSVGLYT